MNMNQSIRPEEVYIKKNLATFGKKSKCEPMPTENAFTSPHVRACI